MNPMGMFTAMAVVSSVFLGSVWAGDNRAIINSFKRQNPTAFVAMVMVASYLLVSLLGSVMVFMSAITLPLICEFVEGVGECSHNIYMCSFVVSWLAEVNRLTQRN